jgi:hypothetical protein
MANLVGPSLYAGFLDVGFVPDTSRRVVVWLHRLIAVGRRSARTADSGLRFFEVKFLTIQRKVFEDQALMHEAYLEDGLRAVRDLRAAGIVDEATEHAWEEIDHGDTTGLHEGNRMLLFREQFQILERYYAQMRGYDPPEGRGFTYLLTLVALPSIPDAKSYAAVFPVVIPRSGGVVTLSTPLPAGNIAVFENRWDLIESDTWPAYQRLLEDPPAMDELVTLPIAERAAKFRMSRRFWSILVALARWRIELRKRVRRRRGVAATVIAVQVTLDLTTPPTRASIGLSPGSDTRTWASTARPFPLQVLLPRGRVYSTEARLVVVVSSRREDDPDRLMVKLPSADLDGARRTLEELARTWHADRDAIAQWAAAAAEASQDAYAYATRVFRAEPIDFVRLELQVEHHVLEGDYVVDVLFSWTAVEER